MSKTAKSTNHKTTKTDSKPKSKSTSRLVIKSKKSTLNRNAGSKTSKQKKSNTKKYSGSKTSSKKEALVKICNGHFCQGEEIPVSEFYFNNKNEGILHSLCKKCHKHEKDSRKYSYPERVRCPTCNKKLPIEDFNFRSKKTGEREKRCGKCSYAIRDKAKRAASYKKWAQSELGKQTKAEIRERGKSQRINAE